MAGGEDGCCVVWDSLGGVEPTPLPHASLGGAPIHTVIWNSRLHVAAVCGMGSWTPCVLVAYDSSRPRVFVPGGRTMRSLRREEKALRDAERATAGTRYKKQLPATLTPSIVHALLEEVRADARNRGVLPWSSSAALPKSDVLREYQQQEALKARQPLFTKQPPLPLDDQLVVQRPPPPRLPYPEVAAARARQAERKREQRRISQRLSPQ
ncbi:hypothetical protein DUNSADRAFT_3177, partial [Dunaliella salina]